MTRSKPQADAARAHLSSVLIRTGEEDRDAFRELYALTQAKLFGITLRICGNAQAAEDVLHDVYLTIWKRAGGWEPGRASPITWLATIARARRTDRTFMLGSATTPEQPYTWSACGPVTHPRESVD